MQSRWSQPLERSTVWFTPCDVCKGKGPPFQNILLPPFLGKVGGRFLFCPRSLPGLALIYCAWAEAKVPCSAWNISTSVLEVFDNNVIIGRCVVSLLWFRCVDSALAYFISFWTCRCTISIVLFSWLSSMLTLFTRPKITQRSVPRVQLGESCRWRPAAY